MEEEKEARPVSEVLGVEWPLNRHYRHGAFAALPSARTYYELVGPKEGEPVVLVHGAMQWSYIWADLVDELVERGFRVLVYGRGFSECPPGAVYRVDLYITQLLELTSLLFPDKKFTLIGVSMGGAISATFASRHAERVNRIVLIAPAGAGVSKTWAQTIVTIPILGWQLLWYFGHRLLKSSAMNMVKLNFVNLDLLSPALIDDIVKRNIWQFEAKSGFLESLHSTLVYFNMDTLYLEWNSIPGKTPVLILWGDMDRIVPFQGHAKVSEAIPHAHLIEMKGAGHGVQFEQKALVLNHITTFLVEAKH